MTFSKLTVATITAFSFATASFAGTLVEPVEETIVAQDDNGAVAGSSAGSAGNGSLGIAIPLLGLLALAGLVSSSDS